MKISVMKNAVNIVLWMIKAFYPITVSSHFFKLPSDIAGRAISP
jgi:hypothetical protein